jgi:hypothetical protein
VPAADDDNVEAGHERFLGMRALCVNRETVTPSGRQGEAPVGATRQSTTKRVRRNRPAGRCSDDARCCTWMQCGPNSCEDPMLPAPGPDRSIPQRSRRCGRRRSTAVTADER